MFIAGIVAFVTPYYGSIRKKLSHSCKHHLPYVANNFCVASRRAYELHLGALPISDNASNMNVVRVEMEEPLSVAPHRWMEREIDVHSCLD